MTSELDDNTPGTNPLLRELTESESTLLEVIFSPMYGPLRGWPVWSYVSRTIFQRNGSQAAGTLAQLPRVTDRRLGGHRGYGLVWRSESALPSPQPGERIGLTVAGLRALASPSGSRVAQWVVDVAGGLAHTEVSLFASRSDEVPDSKLSLNRYFSMMQPTRESPADPSPQALSEILIHEPLMPHPYEVGDERYVHGDESLRIFLGVNSVEDYLDVVTNELGTDDGSWPAPAVSPLTLPQTLDYLAVVMAEDPRFRSLELVGRTRAAAFARLATDVGSHEEFQDRISALFDVLDKLAIPKLAKPELERLGEVEQPKSVRRLALMLRERLGEESTGRIDSAEATLLAAVHMRGAGQHSDAARKALTAHTTLGLRYPITDYGSAWNQIRSRVSDALDALRVEIEVTRPTP